MVREFYVANRYFWKPEIKFDYIHLMENPNWITRAMWFDKESVK